MRNRRHSSAWIPALGPIPSSATRPTHEIRERKISLRILYLSLFALLVTFLPASAHAYPGGIAGYSGKTGPTCTMCHSTGTTTVTMSLPTSVTSGSTYMVTLSETGGSGSGGLDVAATAGTFTAGTGTKVLSGELVQSNGSSTHSWAFSWTAPTVTTNTTASLYGAAMDSYGGGTGTVVANTTVMPAATVLPTLNLSPTSVTFNYQMGGSAPVAQNVATSSSTSTAIMYTATSSAAWLTTTPSGTTPGTLALSVNPTGLAAGTYTGTVSIASAGEAKSPVMLPVTLNVTSGSTNPTINLTPSSLSFSYAAGSTTAGTKTLNLASSTGTVLSYTATASGGSWLSVGSASGSTPGSVSVSANPTGMAAGSYSGTIMVTSSGASNSPQSVPVTLTVTSGTGSGHLTASPRWLSFNYAAGQSAPSPKTVSVGSSGTPLSYTAAGFGSSWLSVSPSGGTTSGKISIAVNPDGLPTGTYAAVVQISAPGSRSIDLPVSLNVGTSSGGGGGGGDDSAIQAMPITSDPTQSGSVNAKWVSGAGVPNANESNDPQNQGLLITKSSTSDTKASAGIVINNADGMALTALGFDIRNGSQCTTRTPAFVVVTSDGVNHTVGGCSKGTKQSSPAQGWTRLRFDPSNPAQATPPIASGTTVKTIQLVINEGPEAGSGMVILDNILVNKTVIGKQ